MIPVTDLRKGATFQIDGMPYKVLEYNHIKMGRGGATIRVITRNLKTGAVETKSFNNGSSFERITTAKRKLQYLYSDGTNAAFMDPRTYDQQEISLQILGSDIAYLQEGQEIDVMFWDDQALGVELPPNVVLKVAEADPGVKGNSATNIYKQVKMENGLIVKAPLFIKPGDKLRVDTRTGEYVERAS
jgi:elongation factor P